jgi:DNA polymerase-3 subunit gamma/tau
MSEYQVIARKFRPQSFKEVIGQEAIVTTLKNAIKFKRLAQAYLFCGSRGTGKTTLARIFAKALNCLEPTADLEPCNQCSACREIASGSSMDVLEIDGASNRGIEDIRQINENVGYATASGNYKIYIIDEVHMLTKEAFNALLKTLEEPPPKVKFFFATTEPHKVLSTILSRCQRFNLNRIPTEKIQAKLSFIMQQMGVESDEDALHLLAQQAEGGLRDAESLLDQILAFEEGKITVASVNAILGLTDRETYFDLDSAGKDGNLAKAFEIAHYVFSQGKDILHFVEGLIEHYRNILLTQLAGKASQLINVSSADRVKYENTARLYTQEQCLTLIDYLLQAQNQIRFSSSSRIALEAILLHVMRSHFRIPIEVLVRRLSVLEQSLTDKKAMEPTALPINLPANPAVQQTIQPSAPPQQIIKPLLPPQPAIKAPMPPQQAAPPAKIVAKPVAPPHASMSEDPTPSAADLGIKKAVVNKKAEAPPPKPPAAPLQLTKPVHYYDTLLHFAAVELEGKVQRIHH